MTAPATIVGARHQPGFADTLASEWTKLRSIRATYIQIVLALVLALGMAALIALAIGSSFDQLNPEDQATFDPVVTSQFGMAVGGIVMIVLAVTFVSSEYTSGMIRQTFTSTPRRLRVLTAKFAIIMFLMLSLGTIASLGSFFIGQAVLGSYEGVPTATLQGDTLRAIVAASLTAPFFPLIGASLGAILRSTASAITTVLSLMFVPGILSALLPDAIQENVMRYLPNNATDQLMVTRPDVDSPLHLDVLPAALLALVWFAVFAIGAGISITRRDV
jgi:ABC-type transport system involved in multi-copper enzyme maturation permease subunit